MSILAIRLPAAISSALFSTSRLDSGLRRLAEGSTASFLCDVLWPLTMLRLSRSLRFTAAGQTCQTKDRRLAWTLESDKFKSSSNLVSLMFPSLV
ncbi:hypothetical protein F5X99DRAFT_403297 [Biscogniauxia marginata]|nr:hypothetical protein F5X99DRAFT_403297 [Biscogniauxia marginata]